MFRNAGPVAVANRELVTVVDAAIDDGAAPAPPPIKTALAANAADDAHVDAEEKYGMPPDVPATVRAKVPLPVIGEPPTDTKPPVKVSATLVTVPVGTAPPSVRVQVVDDTVQVTRWPVTGTAVKPAMVLLVVAPLAQMVCAAAEPLESCNVPAPLPSVPNWIEPAAVPPTDFSVPVLVTWKPMPFASACQGIMVDPDAVVNQPRIPVPVFDAVSVHLNMLLVEVAAPTVHVVVFALPMLSARVVVGLVSADQAGDPAPQADPVAVTTPDTS